jgi:sucrose-6-phosphate hydrolase SacC (GH32 family)
LKLKFLLCLAVLALLAGSLVAAPGGYLFVTFQNGKSLQSEQVYFGLSQDGKTWTALNGSKPVLVSNIGEKGARDPYILRSHDGSKFYLIATDLSWAINSSTTRATTAGSHSILVWESCDLVNWSQPRLVAVAASDAGCTWAPEAIYDESAGNYLVFWASTSASDNYAKQRIWASRTTDFRTFSAPFIYIEKANHVIDADIVRDGSHFYRFIKDETNKAIAMETSDQLLGTWAGVPGFTLAAMQGYEGPECYQLANGSWCLIADHYSAGTGYAPFTTSNLASGSFAAGTGFSFPFPFRHGAVLPISTEEYNRLNAAYQTSSRIVIHLPFNETAGTTSADLAGRAWDATLVNGASRVAGKGGNVVSLSGSSQYVSLPAGAVYSLTDFTVSAWVKINTLSQWSRIFDFGTGITNYMFLTPKAGGTGNVRFAITTSGGNGEQKIDGTAPLPTGAWTHVAVSVQGSLGVLYVNGVEVGRNSAMSKNPSLLNATTQNWLGRSQFSGDPYLNGQIDDFRVYSGGLSASAVQALYNDGAPGTLASPWLDQDLGVPSLAGSAGTGEGGYTGLSAGGAGIQGTADEGHFIYQPWTGDGVLTTRLETVTANASSVANAGLMMRKDLTSSAPCIYLGMTQTGALTWQHRDSASGSTTATAASTTPAAPWLRITRYGNVFTAYTSADGSAWTQVGSPVTLALPQTIHVGMAMSSGSSTALEVARFTNTSMGATPPPPAPSGLSASAGATSIQLSWTGVPEATSYTIKRSTSLGGPFTTVASGVSASSYVDSPAANGTTYYYAVAGTNSGGEGAPSSVASATLYSEYQRWKIASGLDVNIADSATPGGDGAPVLLKYTIGAAPGAIVSAPFTLVTTPSRGISFTRLSPARERLVVQASSDLDAWDDIATLAAGSDSWTGAATVTEDASVTPRRVTVLDDPAFAADPKRFFRLLVENADDAGGPIGANPIVQTRFTADPAPLVYNGVVYLYAGHDEDNASGFLMRDWQCYSSTDMVNWTDRGTFASLATFPWANQTNGAWAAQVVPRNGKFYLYATVFAPGNTIGVAVSDSPTGPFVDALGKPLVGGPSGVTGYIDPTVLIDGDGQAYLYWGNPNLWYVKLNPDMISTSGAIVKDPSINSSFHYQEGPWAYKRNGLYYMAYASTATPEGIGYAMSNSPTGPWQPMGYVMKPDSRSSGNHPGIIDYRGKSYVFGFNYKLNDALTTTHRERRSVCVAEVRYNTDGTIQEVPWWDEARAVKQIGTLNPYTRVEAETICWSQGMKSEPSSQGGMCVYPTATNAFIKVQGVNFGVGAKLFTASVASTTSGVLELHLDSATGPLVGTCTIPSTGDVANWTTVSGLIQNAAGLHDLYFILASGGAPRFDWWSFQ